ncbi:hypothetical protein FJ976_14080 [Mesorhizobium sp. B1-1-9]|nr:hypothetical protein FJ978_19385 [Mesorhizobium sp. B1-1-7]TPN51766.1 hypothetical protein FJ976_14080 [Mesorhizobium sp. B1-1-9]
MKLPISPPAGEMPGRAEGGAVPPTCQPIVPSVFGWVTDAESSVPSHPPLSCRTSPPQGGRLAMLPVFANRQPNIKKRRQFPDAAF